MVKNKTETDAIGIFNPIKVRPKMENSLQKEIESNSDIDFPMDFQTNPQYASFGQKVATNKKAKKGARQNKVKATSNER